MPRYLVEAYCAQEADGAARAARLGLAHGPDSVRFLRSLFVPEDQICFHLIDAPSIVAATRAIDRAEIANARIVEAVEWETTNPSSGGNQR